HDAVLTGAVMAHVRTRDTDMSDTLTCVLAGRDPNIDGVPAADILAAHAEYVASAGACGRAADFGECDMRGLESLAAHDLTGLKAAKAVFCGLDMRGCKLQGASLEQADLRGVDLREADLRGVNLCGARLNRADLRGCDLGPLLMDDERLRPARLAGAVLRYANLCGTSLRNADLTGCDLRWAETSDADFSDACLDGTLRYESAELPVDSHDDAADG
ncbi:MAG: pentapeptide repeat-containing protein, partial [Alphaproteobacteria bacterium]